jgi:K+-sensing histidine kinase KdpD
MHLVRITDSGTGLCGAGDRFRIFESRWPQESAESEKIHLGFGLYAARELLAPHGGSINLVCGEQRTSAEIRMLLPEPRA